MLHLLDGHLLGGNAGVLEGLLLQRLADLGAATRAKVYGISTDTLGSMFPRQDRRITYTVRFLMLRLILVRSSEKRMMDECSMSISSSVHFLQPWRGNKGHRNTPISVHRISELWTGLTYPDGDSALGCSCMVRSPSLLNACPAAVKISPT